MDCAYKPLSEWTQDDKLCTVKAYMGVVTVATQVGDDCTAEKYRQCIAEMVPMLELTEAELVMGCLGCTAERVEMVMSEFNEFNRMCHVLQNLGIPTLAV